MTTGNTLLLDTNALYYWSGAETAGNVDASNIGLLAKQYSTVMLSEVTRLEMYTHYEHDPAKLQQVLTHIQSLRIAESPHPWKLESGRLLEPNCASDVIDAQIKRALERRSRIESGMLLHFVNSLAVTYAEFVRRLQPIHASEWDAVYTQSIEYMLLGNKTFFLATCAGIVSRFYGGHEDSGVFKSDTLEFVTTVLHAVSLNHFLAQHKMKLQDLSPASPVNFDPETNPIYAAVLRSLNDGTVPAIAKKKKLWSDLHAVLAQYKAELSSVSKGTTDYIVTLMMRVLANERKIEKNDLMDSLVYDHAVDLGAHLLTFDAKFLSLVDECDPTFAQTSRALNAKCLR